MKESKEKMPHRGGWYDYTPGHWQLMQQVRLWKVEKYFERFIVAGVPRRVLVEDTPGSGRHCKQLRMGGSAAMQGYTPWVGRWRRCADQELAATPHQDYAYAFPNTM